jgi:hypothetical protein
MRREVPPPGRAMTFREWSLAIVCGVRTYLPDAQAVRRAEWLVILRHGGREALLKQDGSSCWVTFSAGAIATTMASLFDERRDDFTVQNLGHTVAGYFDARFTRG